MESSASSTPTIPINNEPQSAGVETKTGDSTRTPGAINVAGKAIATRRDTVWILVDCGLCDFKCKVKSTSSKYKSEQTSNNVKRIMLEHIKVKHEAEYLKTCMELTNAQKLCEQKASKSA